MLMLLPLMVVGPFFFLGLSFPTALVTSVTTVGSFIAAAIIWQVETPVTLRAAVLMIASAVICAMAARHIEKRSRENFLQHRLIAQLAEQDALTGTKNRRVLDEHLTRLWQQGIEAERTLAVLLIDVDHFKAYNDRYGHQAGDTALCRVAQAMQGFISRPLHLLARYGGEEFAAILYDCDVEQALRIADGMRRAVRDLCIEHRESKIWPAVTLSIGVAVVKPARARNPRSLLQLADEALYKAKARGRNRVELLDEEEIGHLVTGVFSNGTLSRNA
jgi:diguanylate cyclase (GGDEF)-like protein